MSSGTRHAPAGSPFRQERYCSSPELERGLMGNLVAKRCEAIKASEDRDLIWFLQMLSHSERGLDGLVEGLLEQFSDRIATKSMHRFGFKPGQIFTAEQVRKVRDEMDHDVCARAEYPVKGDEEEDGPDSYPASVFVKACREAAQQNLSRAITALCLDPAAKLDKFQPWYFPQLIASLHQYRSAWIKQRREGLVITRIGDQVEDALCFCLKSRGLVLIHGYARTGKTFAAKRWCGDLHPGVARYVEVPPGASDIGFFRVIAESLGVSINLNSKAHQLRDRCEAVLFTGQQMLILDEAHRCWPESNYRDALPFRLSWIMMMVNRGIPVALITTKQFFAAQRRTERKTGWASDQFQGRLLHTEALPDSLSQADLRTVARVLLPEGDDKTIEILTTYAEASSKYLAGIESAVKRARYVAEKQGRERVTRSDIKQAIKSAVIPSDNALNRELTEDAAPAVNGLRRNVRGVIGNGHSDRLQLPCTTDFSTAQTGEP